MVLLRCAWVENRGLLIVAHVGALIPLARLGWAYQQGTLLVDPVGMITMRTGRAGLTLLLLSLACTPLITLTGWEAVGRLRRELGLYAAAYVGLHALTFLGLDYGFAWSLIGRAVWQQRYLLAGVVAGVVLGGPALTSLRAWQRRLGQGWSWLHRLGYLAGILAVLHFLWQVKDLREPLWYAIVLSLLLLLRVPFMRTWIVATRRRLLA